MEARLIECAHHHGISVFHHLDGDDPFFSRDLVVESMQCFLRGAFSRITPCIASLAGSGLVGTSYNLNPPNNARVEPLPDPPDFVWPQRLTLDYQEDYELIKAVDRMVGGYMAPRQAVDDLFRSNPSPALDQLVPYRRMEGKTDQ